MTDVNRPLDELHPNERLKHDSDYLRGGLQAALADRVTGAVPEADTQLTKFHGIYQQDDRELRSERRRQKLEPFYQFMVRVRLPGGLCTPRQWLALDDLSRNYGNGTMRLTTRQTFQFHGILKRDLKAHIQGINAVLLDTIAACGDVNRNVISTANPHLSSVHRAVYDHAHALSAHLLPRSRAYHEIFLDEERVAAGEPETEPLYGRTYLPRKFKIALAVPPDNDVDLYAHDLGFIAIVEDGGLAGFNVAIGGGMGMTHGEPATFPRLSDVIGFCTPDQVLDVAEQVVCVQRDGGDRVDRKHARLKYTVETLGVEGFRERVESGLGFALGAPRKYHFESTGDRYGWRQGEDGRWHLTLFVENGRIADFDGGPGGPRLRSALREIASSHDGDYALTTNQNVVITNVADGDRAAIDSVLREHGVDTTPSPLRGASMACVAFPTCGLAMAESERYLPGFLSTLEAIMADAGLADDSIVVRMTGCPNGCARPYLAEIG
ncbi:MAG TPA: NADPH-dependent assimilatory sulfite reductase hemoprotein subunit, partial [Gammaproteobacteria bacterium]|nr:NADPH-dependent assimilatory sulfite reductase hemoprotein subunit [Gammaproteobacteria bacterium]